MIRLDRRVEAAAVEADPDAVLATFDRPLLVDEWQAVPEVLGSVKRAIDDGAPAGSYVLTGSVRAELLDLLFALDRLPAWHTTRLNRLTRSPKRYLTGAAPNANDARNLAWLRDKLGEQFTGGIVFHSGPRAYSLGDRIVALPIAAIWQR